MSVRSETRLGIVMGVAAYTIWGLLPLFIRALQALPVADILAHRVIWSLAILLVLATLVGRWAAIRATIRTPRLLLALGASTLLIATNWAIYVYSVNGGHTLQASLGYFINPLVNVALGVLFLRERLGRMEVAAILLAAAGVAALAIQQGGIPLIPLGLALSFGLYGLVRKVIGLGPVEGLLIETGLLFPLAIGWLALMPGAMARPDSPPLWMLVASGFVTTIPMLLFAGAANRMRYSELGLLQYIGPTLQLLIAVAVFGEPMLPIHLLAFALIWSGLAVYVLATWHRGRVTPALPE
ncbi:MULTISPECIES: EamA family transporter RarD [unclassified Sphingomonas]|uniref:EamA family transporter RarD n=1 Tax=unclassified Sphingomonas TaxID=196159 RepID=UPI0006FD3515|nr:MULTISPECIES: EamA family transporter RarD [unclassified Sphingomonas]KQX22688.1 multidrug DMT transporter [Sphingomonas sp. Root1294]KQY67832.1 multidrug DMT transporter [Sphingomonas sp. Root50]KRB88756.1 multidrug DMT transporter [Sphingomonas sp. Root720]